MPTFLFFKTTSKIVNNGFEYFEGWPQTIPDNLINPPVDFSSPDASNFVGFEYSENWPQTIPDNSINPSVDFSSPDASNFVGFETGESWP